ncbi:hypothetical protein ACFSTC_21445 [Nonomuraea ferruginea]
MLLPQPLGPMMQMNSPLRISRSIPCTAVNVRLAVVKVRPTWW